MNSIKQIIIDSNGINSLRWIYDSFKYHNYDKEGYEYDYMIKFKQIIEDLDIYINCYEKLDSEQKDIKSFNFIDAKTAKNNSENNLKVKHSNELKIIEEKIAEAIKLGKFSVTFENAYFSKETLDVIKQYGYSISYGRHYNDEYTEIKWS